jgi:hypothetical protein
MTVNPRGETMPTVTDPPSIKPEAIGLVEQLPTDAT